MNFLSAIDSAYSPASNCLDGVLVANTNGLSFCVEVETAAAVFLRFGRDGDGVKFGSKMAVGTFDGPGVDWALLKTDVEGEHEDEAVVTATNGVVENFSNSSKLPPPEATEL